MNNSLKSISVIDLIVRKFNRTNESKLRKLIRSATLGAIAFGFTGFINGPAQAEKLYTVHSVGHFVESKTDSNSDRVPLANQDSGEKIKTDFVQPVIVASKPIVESLPVVESLPLVESLPVIGEQTPVQSMPVPSKRTPVFLQRPSDDRNSERSPSDRIVPDEKDDAKDNAKSDSKDSKRSERHSDAEDNKNDLDKDRDSMFRQPKAKKDTPRPEQNNNAVDRIRKEFGNSLGSLSIDIRETAEKQPEDRSHNFVGAGQFSDSQKMWLERTLLWEPTNLAYNPLYFQDTMLERWGQSTGPVRQSLLSGMHFGSSFALLPLRALKISPWECVFPVDYPQPGDCVPFTTDIPERIRR